MADYIFLTDLDLDEQIDLLTESDLGNVDLDQATIAAIKANLALDQLPGWLEKYSTAKLELQFADETDKPLLARWSILEDEAENAILALALSNQDELDRLLTEPKRDQVFIDTHHYTRMDDLYRAIDEGRYRDAAVIAERRATVAKKIIRDHCWRPDETPGAIKSDVRALDAIAKMARELSNKGSAE